MFDCPKGSSFRASITSKAGLFELICYVDEKNDDGSPLFSRVVDENPPGPLNTMDQAKKLAIELARLYGFQTDEVAWENE